MSELHCIVYLRQSLERVYVFQPLKCAIIGRHQSCDVWLSDAYVSRQHACAEYVDDGAVIRDMGSRNGTTLNGQPLLSECKVRDGDVIQIGPYRLQLSFHCSDDPRHLNSIDHTTRGHSDSKPGQGQQASFRQPKLTPSQYRVLEAFVEGLSEKEIANRLGLSIHTVHTHAKAIYKTYAISSRGELLKAWADGRSNECNGLYQ